MNSIVPRRRRTSCRLRSTGSAHLAVAPDPGLAWIHDGIRHRVTVWPELAFEIERTPGEWTAGDPDEAAFASAALGVSTAAWRRFAEYLPADLATFLAALPFGRVAALHVITRCPELLDELAAVPALTAFVAAHRSLRGTEDARWAEITAVVEREGIFGLLQWLGLPASRQTLTILQHVSDPDLPQRLLSPLRAALWEPEAIWALSHAPELTDARIAAACHALAA